MCLDGVVHPAVVAVLSGWLQVSKLHHDLEEAVHTNTQLLADSSAKQVELKGKEDELAALRVEMAKVVKVGPGWGGVLLWVRG